MQSLGNGITNLIAGLDPEKAKAFKAARYNAVYKEAVEDAWGDSPDAAQFLLAHTNSMYIEVDRRPAKRDSGPPRVILGVYMDDAAARAELNARREVLRLKLAQKSVHVDEVVMLPSRLGMRDRHLFPDSVKYVKRHVFGFEPDDAPGPDPAPPIANHVIEETAGAIEDPEIAARFQKAMEAAAGDHGLASVGVGAGCSRMAVNRDVYDQSRMLVTFKKALCGAVGDIDLAYSLLGRIEGAKLSPVIFDASNKSSRTGYVCYLYSRDRDRVAGILSAYRKDLIAKAKPLGLLIMDIKVSEAPSSLHGKQAFPRSGWPIPLNAYETFEPSE